MSMVSKLIDDRNRILWNDLNAWREIGIEYNDNNWYSCFTGPNRITIYLNKQIISPGGFTHELLHILLYKKEVYVSQSLHSRVREMDAVKWVISRELVDHIGNCLDHIKMLPIYFDMGYDWGEFATDSYQEKITEDDILTIQSGLRRFDKYDARIVDFFIGKFIAAVACPNTSADYTSRFNAMRQVERELFDVLSPFVDLWKAFDIDANDPFNSYRDVLSVFLDPLELWVNERSFFNRVR